MFVVQAYTNTALHLNILFYFIKVPPQLPFSPSSHSTIKLPYFAGFSTTIYSFVVHICILLSKYAMEALDDTEFTGENVEWNSHGSTDLLEIDRDVEFF